MSRPSDCKRRSVVIYSHVKSPDRSVSCEIPSLRITVECEDFVDSTLPVFVRNCKVYDNGTAKSANPLKARILFFLTPCMGAREGGNTATYDPDLGGILCFNRNRYMLVSGSTDETGKIGVQGYTVKWRVSPSRSHCDMREFIREQVAPDADELSSASLALRLIV